MAWAELPSGNAEVAENAIRELLRRPVEAVRLAATIPAIAKVSDEDIRTALAETAKAEDDVRAAARTRLIDWCLDNPEVLERVNELSDIFRGFWGPTHKQSGNALLHLRAVELMERLGTPEAKAVLKTWAGGAPNARLTAEAKAALERLGR